VIRNAPSSIAIDAKRSLAVNMVILGESFGYNNAGYWFIIYSFGG